MEAGARARARKLVGPGMVLALLLITRGVAGAPPVAGDVLEDGARSLDVPYVTHGSPAMVAQIAGLCPPGAAGIALTLRSRRPTQLRLYLIPEQGPSRYRFVVLEGGDRPREIRLPLEAFDVDPQVERGTVPGGGALIVIDVPGFLRGPFENRLRISSARVLRHRPPRPREERPDNAPPGRPEAGPGLRDRLLGGWLGKAAGGRLGLPREGREDPDWTGVEARTRGFAGDPVRGFGPDDDTSLMVRHLLVFQRLGEGLSADDLLDSWRKGHAHEFLWKTERQALERRDRGTPATDCGLGPLGETLAARIRADLWGMLHPGDPEAALRLVERDAALSAAGAGRDSARFFAAAASLALACESVDQLLDVLLALPATRDGPQARLGTELRARHRAGEDLRTLRAWVETTYFVPARRSDPDHAWAHALPNDALVLIALLDGRGDFARTVALAASLGWDSDCNAATAGCLLGLIGGAGALPASFREALDDRLRVAIPRREHWSLEYLAALTARLATPEK